VSPGLEPDPDLAALHAQMLKEGEVLGGPRHVCCIPHVADELKQSTDMWTHSIRPALSAKGAKFKKVHLLERKAFLTFAERDSDNESASEASVSDYAVQLPDILDAEEALEDVGPEPPTTPEPVEKSEESKSKRDDSSSDDSESESSGSDNKDSGDEAAEDRIVPRDNNKTESDEELERIEREMELEARKASGEVQLRLKRCSLIATQTSVELLGTAPVPEHHITAISHLCVTPPDRRPCMRASCIVVELRTSRIQLGNIEPHGINSGRKQAEASIASFPRHA